MKKIEGIKVFKLIYILIILAALFKLIWMNINNLEDFYRISNYKLKLRTYDAIGWREVKGNKGVYLLTSKDCPYCIKNINKAMDILAMQRECVGISTYVVELDINEYFNNKKLNNFLDEHEVNTIPCILFISKESEEVKHKLLEFEDIKHYNIK